MEGEEGTGAPPTGSIEDVIGGLCRPSTMDRDFMDKYTASNLFFVLFFGWSVAPVASVSAEGG